MYNIILLNFAIDNVHITTQLDQFFGADLSLALELDSLNQSHPILQEVASPDEINSLFDTISYSKVGERERERERGEGE